jgi:hypothetical protein
MKPYYKQVGFDQSFEQHEMPEEFTRGQKAIISSQDNSGYGHWGHQTIAWDGKNFHHYSKFGPGSIGEGEEGEDNPWSRDHGFREHHAKTLKGLAKRMAPNWFTPEMAHNDWRDLGQEFRHASHTIPDSHRTVKLPGKAGSLMHEPLIAADAAEEAGFPRMAKVLRNVKRGPLAEQFQEHRLGKSADGAIHFFGPGYHWIHSKHLV